MVKVNEETAYAVLGVVPAVSDHDLRRAYLALAQVHHPDKGGTVDGFQRINYAYARVKTPALRERYDKLLRVMGKSCTACKGTGVTTRLKSWTVVITTTCTTCKGSGIWL